MEVIERAHRIFGNIVCRGRRVGTCLVSPGDN